MNAAEQLKLVSVAEYLEAELSSTVKHEYLGGIVYAMSGGRNLHNLVATNATSALWARLRDQPCRVFNSDTKVRIQLPGHTRFYYPDLSVVCQPNPLQDVYQDAPAVVVEVLSDSTRRTDLGEKKDAYLSILSLFAYIVIEPKAPAVIVFRRSDQGFVREAWQGLDAVLPLAEIGVSLPLAEIYANVEFPADP